MKNQTNAELNIYASILTDLYKTCDKPLRVIDEQTGYSEASIRRWMGGKGKIPIDAFYTLVAKMGGNIQNVQAAIGGLSIEEYDKTGFASIEQVIDIMTADKERMREDFETQIEKARSIREDMQINFANALKALTDSYSASAAQQLKIINDLEGRNTELKNRLDRTAAKNKRLYQAFAAMLTLVVMLVAFIVFLMLADVPMIGGGN